MAFPDDRPIIHDPLCSPSDEQVPRRFYALLSWVLVPNKLMSRAIPYQHRETDNQQGRSPRPRPPLHPGKATTVSMQNWLAKWNRLHSDDSCSFQWCDVDGMMLSLWKNSSPEYFCHHGPRVSGLKCSTLGSGNQRLRSQTEGRS